ncbi:MAG: sigma-70 family RNA polymerase sigma factor [Dehalococcoidia bacterium]
MESVYHFAVRLTRDAEQAQDLVQETYLRAYRSWKTYTPGTRVKSWLFTICRNCFLRGAERSRRHEEIVAAMAEEDPSTISAEPTVFRSAADRGADGTFWRSLVDEEVLRAIDDLPDDFRHAVVLSDLEDLSYPEIAQILEVPVGTVKSRLFRGRRILQERLFGYAVEAGLVGKTTERNHGTNPKETQ